MTAAVLREAADLMRKCAEGGTPGPWRKVERSHGGPVVGSDDGPVLMGYASGRSDVIHAASWHPVVALAVADWLEQAADEPWCCDDCKFDPENPNRLIHRAVRVARAYLGDPA